MDWPAAPFFSAVAHGPETGAAYWGRSTDGLRLRVAAWPCEGARGTVLIFTGRTEYVEKYGQAAAALAARGFAACSIDWRGQGLSDRLALDPMVGHVKAFADYQNDVSVLLDAARALALPEPYFLLAHSMGGAIGLRALMNGLPVRSACFTAPMWGIGMALHLRPAAWMLGNLMPTLGRGEQLPPGTRLENYILTEGFENNMLTTDAAQFEIMRQQLLQHPELVLGGPSFIWLREALAETRKLARRPSPNLPCLTYLGTNERIVDIRAAHRRMAAWPQGRLELVEGGEHEVLMESAERTAPLFDGMAALFQETQPA